MKTSTEGYKRNSKDKKQPALKIPSNNITMKGVDFPVFGIDNHGNMKLMIPDQDYLFPGDYVVETPVLQKGGQKPSEELNHKMLQDAEDAKYMRSHRINTRNYENKMRLLGESGLFNKEALANDYEYAMSNPNAADLFFDKFSESEILEIIERKKNNNFDVYEEYCKECDHNKRYTNIGNHKIPVSWFDDDNNNYDDEASKKFNWNIADTREVPIGEDYKKITSKTGNLQVSPNTVAQPPLKTLTKFLSSVTDGIHNSA